MHFDEVLKIVGEFGRYQQIRIFLLCVYSIVSAWHSLNMVFVGAVPSHHCDLSSVNNSSNYTQAQLRLILIPEGEKCRMYNQNETYSLLKGGGINMTSLISHKRSLEPCPNGLQFSKNMYKSTIASEFNMVCSQEHWRSISKSVYFFGRLVGALVFGQLSDRFGRRPTFTVCIALLLLAGSVAAASPSIIIFLPIYFLQGAAQTGAFLVAFTLSTELVGPRYRVMVGFVIQMFYSIGYMTLSAMAYLLRDWRHLEIAITVPTIGFILYWWFLPESIRWLLSQNRQAEAEVVLQNVARVNSVDLPPDFSALLKEDQSNTSDRKYTFLDLVRTWRIARLSLSVWFNWLVNALVYYGLSLNTENLAGDPYLNFCVAGALEIPVYILSIVIINKVGRRWPLIITMVTGGVACIASGFIPSKGSYSLTIFTIVLAMIGKAGITASYAIIYLVGAEVFPTVIRSIGMGTSSMSARLGGILAPQILELKTVFAPLPLVVFGVLSIVAGGLAFFLPETHNKPLPQGLDQAHSTRSIVCCWNKDYEKADKRPYHTSDNETMTL